MKVLFLIVLFGLVSCGGGSPQGVSGVQGKNCFSRLSDDGVNVICNDIETVVPDIDDEIEFVEICPDFRPATNLKETLIFLNGKFLAFLDGRHKRLVVLKDGTYRTTDGRRALFRIGGDKLVCLSEEV